MESNQLLFPATRLSLLTILPLGVEPLSAANGDLAQDGGPEGFRFHPTRLFTLQFLVLMFVMTVPQAFATGGDDSVQFQIAPYVWLAGQNGTVATLPGVPPADIDIDFYDDILGNLNGALMLVAEARKGPFGIVTDIAYTDIEIDTPTPGDNFSILTSQTKSWIVSGAGFYRLFENAHAFFDGLAGLRYWSVDSELSLSGGPRGTLAIDNQDSWFDPILGVKGMSMIGDSNFFLSGFLITGGFGAGSDILWDVNANLGYQWTQGFSTTIGYRYLSVDYEDGAFLYDISQDGIILGLSWRF